LADAMLAVQGKYLKVTIASSSARLPATGMWTGEIYVAARVILAVATTPPAGDPIRLHVKDGRLLIGTLTAPCFESEPKGITEDAVLNATGLPGPVQKANAALIKKAAKILEPLGVLESDVARLVRDRHRDHVRPCSGDLI
jgi:hypothetical protein